MKIIEMFMEKDGPNGLYNGEKLQTKRHRPKWITVHGETTKGISAKEWVEAIRKGAVLCQFHYVVGRNGIFHLVPEDEITWQAGDGQNGAGNTKSISILVVGNAEAQAAELIRALLKRYGLGTDRVVPHQHWSPEKNCPTQILPHWEAFLRKCGAD